MKRIGLTLAKELIDFTGNADRGSDGSGTRQSDIPESVACSQLEGAVAAHNMLATNRVAYIADEVGLGKTYVALGVMGLVRHFRPDARILVLAPKENIQKKWKRDFGNFVRNNWRAIDNRVKSVQGGPARQPVVCDSLAAFAHDISMNANRDFFLRMTSFSLALKKREARYRYRQQILDYVSWLDSELQPEEPGAFREQYGRALNALLPDIDLLVVDEAHNLRKGFGSAGHGTSNRNRVLGLMLGHPQAQDDSRPWYGPRVRRVLCLSATPFEDDYGDLWRQFDVLGRGDANLTPPANGHSLPLRRLIEDSARDEESRKLVENLLIRRITHLKINGEPHTKNMYRREWRQGGLEQPDDPIAFEDPRQKLIVALVQKKVAEVLGDEKFGNRFQIGMLSSFESFLQSVENTRRKQRGAEADENEDEADEDQGEKPAHFDGQQTQDSEEQRGVDTRALNALIESYRETFGQELPHPKLDATVESLADSFETGEKALVFVRRVATVQELARRLDRRFDAWIERRMKEQLPDELGARIDKLFKRFREDTRADAEPPNPEHLAGDTSGSASAAHDDSAAGNEPASDDAEAEAGDAIQPGVDDDPGGRENFFSWFFRGKGPEGELSGAAFQKNRLSNASAAYSTLFEDDLVSWLLGRPEDPLKNLAGRLRLELDDLRSKLRHLAWGFYSSKHKEQAGSYPRYYVFEAYQAAALHLVAASGNHRDDEIAQKAGEVHGLRFRDHHGESPSPPSGFPAPDSAIGVTTFFTELVRHGPTGSDPGGETANSPTLRDELWPKDEGVDFTESFRRREQRRELLSAMARLGGAYIDLYLLAIRQIGGFEPGHQAAGDTESLGKLARAFVELLDEQRQRPSRFGAYAELSGAAKAFDTLIKVNFPEVPTADLEKLSEIFGRGLQEQNPIGRMAGSVAGRVVRQFRMPGFPLVLISTDVLQEGEDLHTFCRRVIHYGITWTPSAMEQRTGRVDRIGGLAQRTLDGRSSSAEPGEKIQVLYPHLADTVERLQVRRVLLRLDRFLELVHAETLKHERHAPKLDANRDMLATPNVPAPVEGLLKSAFPVRQEWLDGLSDGNLVHRICVKDLSALLAEWWNCLCADLDIDRAGQAGPLERHGVVTVRTHRVGPAGETGRSSGSGNGAVRLQRFELKLRSAGIADTTFMRCSSVIGHVDLHDHGPFDQLRALRASLDNPRLCARWNAKQKKFALSIEASLPFDRTTSQYPEVRDLVCRVAVQADGIEETLLGEDEDAQTPEDANPVGQSSATKEGRQAQQSAEPTTDGRPQGLERIRELLCKRDKVDWNARGENILVDLRVAGQPPGHEASAAGRPPPQVRRQRVRIRRDGDEYVFSTVVLRANDAAQLATSPAPGSRRPEELDPRNGLALRAWRHNAETELVNFTLDAEDNLIGEIRHPVGHLDKDELLIYVQTLATEGDRFEYILTGGDQY